MAPCQPSNALRRFGEARLPIGEARLPRHPVFLPFPNGRKATRHATNPFPAPWRSQAPCFWGSQAANWGSQVAKAHLFPTVPKRTESTLPRYKSFPAPWGSQAGNAHLFSTVPKRTESTLPRYKSVPAPWGSQAPCFWGSQAANWGSQAANAHLFSTVPKRTETTLPRYKSLPAPWGSQAPCFWGSQAANWGSQAAKAHLFSIFSTVLKTDRKDPATLQILPGALGKPSFVLLGKPRCQLGKPGCRGTPFFYRSETDGRHPATLQIC